MTECEAKCGMKRINNKKSSLTAVFYFVKRRLSDIAYNQRKQKSITTELHYDQSLDR